MRRTSLHLDDADLKALERLAEIETQRTGSRVSASQIVRHLIRRFLDKQPSRRFGQDRPFKSVPHDPTLEAMIVRDEDGTIRYWSKEAHSLFKTQFPTSLTRIEREARKALSWEGQHRRRDGSLVTVNSRWKIQRNPGNKSLTVIEVNAA
jgi:hypothetical protein